MSHVSHEKEALLRCDVGGCSILARRTGAPLVHSFCFRNSLSEIPWRSTGTLIVRPVHHLVRPAHHIVRPVHHLVCPVHLLVRPTSHLTAVYACQPEHRSYVCSTIVLVERMQWTMVGTPPAEQTPFNMVDICQSHENISSFCSISRGDVQAMIPNTNRNTSCCAKQWYRHTVRNILQPR